MKSLVIFDLDGTLLNTIDDLGNACNEALRQMGYQTHALTSYPMMVGNGITRLIERALPDEARTERIIAEVRRHFMAYYDNHCCDMTVPYPGIELLLEELTRRNINLAVTSNKYQRAVSLLISRYFSKYNFKVVLGQHDGVPPKPDPSIVFEALSQCPTPKSDVLYVGDSGVDMETARRACVESVGVTWGFRSEKELRAAYADHIIEEPCDLIGLL
ncbi:MAG: HAD family hydrolase [Muribaculaceae bacterium]|nr:HAD family hydrolase [Muribaculaceae bacterium]